MSERGRTGYISITLEMPIEVAEWLSANGEQLGQLARIAAIKEQRSSETNKRQREERLQKRKAELWALGRVGYRKLRHAGGGKDIVKNRDLTRSFTAQLGEDWYTLEQSILRFKRAIESKLRDRRNREINRLYEAGQSNDYIAAQYRIHPGTVASILRADHDDAPSIQFPLAKGKKHSQGTALVAPSVISWDALKQAGERS